MCVWVGGWVGGESTIRFENEKETGLLLLKLQKTKQKQTNKQTNKQKTKNKTGYGSMLL